MTIPDARKAAESEEDPLANELYREHILDLYANPRNYGALAKPTHEQREYNTLCGDEIMLQISTEGKGDKAIVKEVKFSGRGCAISMASASLLTDFIKDKTIAELRTMGGEDLIALLEIPIGPVRMKCALLSFEALKNAISKS